MAGWVPIPPAGKGLSLPSPVGINQQSPLAPLHVGNSPTVSGASDCQILISRNVDDTTPAGNSHAFADSSTITKSGTISYNSFDGEVTISGSNSYGHYALFQDAVKVNLTGGGTLGILYGLVDVPTIFSGTITNAYAVYAADFQGIGGSVGTRYGLYVAPLSKAATNWGVYIDGTTPSYFGGPVTFSSSVKFGATDLTSAWTAFTPTVTTAGGNFTTLGTVKGAYKQIGKTIFFEVDVSVTTVGATASGQVYIGLPPSLIPNRNACVTGREFLTNGKLLNIAILAADQTFMRLLNYDGTVAFTNGNPYQFVVSGVYECT